MPNIKYLIFSVHTYHSIKHNGRKTYTIHASADVFSTSSQPISAVDETGRTGDIPTRIVLELPVLEGSEDIIPFIG
jgi:hypothetical protein